MSQEFAFEEKLEVHRCYTCGIIFAIPVSYIKNRREDGVKFYCPNSHSLAFPKKDESGETSVEKIKRLEQENTEFKDKNIQLLAKLDQVEAQLASQASDPPDSSEDV